MSAPKTREHSKRQTREALIAAGIELFAAQGLDGPSLDAICERAGFTRGAFYVHFRDRDDFLASVMEHVGRPFLEAVLGARDRPEEPLATIIGRFLAAVNDGSYPLTPAGGVHPYQLLDACARSERVRALYVGLIGDAVRRVARAIGHDQDQGTLRADVDAETLAGLLLAVVIGAQTMLDLGAPFEVAASAGVLVRLAQPQPG